MTDTIAVVVSLVGQHQITRELVGRAEGLGAARSGRPGA